eukprot:350988-Chlamydomonas_euryale.AAC.4
MQHNPPPHTSTAARAAGMQHLFDGYGMICRFRIAGGRVHGNQRFVQSDVFKHHEKTGKLLRREFGTAAKVKASHLHGLA